jgi:nicotinamide-nucleotide amidase
MIIGEIIIIGDEILCGEVFDTNSFELAKGLSEAGFIVNSITIIGDGYKAIKETILTRLKEADFLVITGGLGSSWDDKTIKAVAMALNLPLERSDKAYQHLKTYLAKKGKTFLPSHEKLILLPKGSEPLGLGFDACGFKLNYQTKHLYFLPGVPRQMTQILKTKVVPDLKGIFPLISVIYKKTLRLFGISESEVQEKIANLLAESPEIKVSSLPCFPELHLIFQTKKKESLFQIVDKIRSILGNDIFGEDTETMAQVVGKLLLKKGYSLAIAESLTGGLLGHLISNVGGSSAYFERSVVVYNNQAKVEMLGVPKQIISTYGPVSEATVKYMAQGIIRLAKTDVALAITGYAGPTAGPEAEVGKVFIALATPDGIKVSPYFFDGSREEIKMIAAMTALDNLRRYILL